MQSDQQNSLVFSLLQQNDIAECLDCICHVFVKYEPMTSSLGISYDEFAVFTKSLLQSALEAKCSVVARNSETQEFVGCLISQDYLDDEKIDFKSVTPKMEPLFQLINDFNSLKDPNIQRGDLLHMWLIGIQDKYQGRKYASLLLEENLKLGKQSNFKKACVEVTGVKSRAAFLKLGFQEKKFIEYSTFDIDGKKPFETVAGGTGYLEIQL